MFTLGDVAIGPKILCFSVLNMIQKGNFSCSAETDEKLLPTDLFPLSRLRRCQADEDMNAIAQTVFMSVNASIARFGITISILCAFYASHQQQKLCEACVSAPMTRILVLTLLKCHGTLLDYISLPLQYLKNVTLVGFADASHADITSPLCYIVGLVYKPISRWFFSHIITWASHLSIRPFKSPVVAAILATAETIVEVI